MLKSQNQSPIATVHSGSFTGGVTEKTAQDTYKEREKRVNDAIALRIPDRVPIEVLFGFLPASYCGMTIQDVMYDPDKLFQAQLKTVLNLISYYMGISTGLAALEAFKIAGECAGYV